MISTLHIKNIGIINDLAIDLNSGFNVLTGETGAGKTLIIDSLRNYLWWKILKRND
ncbi:MAG TPA: AAA family ATPase [Clostridiaceae bacterium]|jgi:DNA repair protein RecN (Recombination protein N)|nr:AAA family ATPase [Clostridiaceae bacterium]